MNDKQLVVLTSFGLMAGVFVTIVGFMIKNSYMVAIGISYFVFNMLIIKKGKQIEDEDQEC